MKHLFLLLFLSFVFSTCKEKTEKKSFEEKNELHDIINAYIKEVNAKDEAPFVAAIYERTIPFQYSVMELNGVEVEVPPLPVSLYTEEIYDISFQKLLEKAILSKEDVEFMKIQLTSTDNVPYDKLPFYLLDSTRMSLPLMTQLEYKETFLSLKNSFDRWETYFSKYKGCYLGISNPIFNASKSKVYFQTTQMCARLWGHGEIVVMEKSNLGWKVIYREETWVS